MGGVDLRVTTWRAIAGLAADGVTVFLTTQYPDEAQVRARLDQADPHRDLVAGHVTASLLRNLVSTVLVAAVAVGIGFRPHSDPARLAAAVGVLLLFVAAISWLAAAFGLAVSAPGPVPPPHRLKAAPPERSTAATPERSSGRARPGPAADL
jgi:hypothetical protein